MLEIGSHVSYSTFGPGEVVDHRVRLHDGKETTFAVVVFPHKHLEVQLPIGLAGVADRLRPIVGAREARRLLKKPAAPALVLSSVYEEREKAAHRLLRENNPAAWADVLWSYVTYFGNGGLLAVSDRELVSDSIGRLSCEAGYALNEAPEVISAELWKPFEATPKKRPRNRKGAAAPVEGAPEAVVGT
ncbi:hypothetical protein [Miltoncostaea oceani]|uniref:hypothetical protein n=1 Tax=Miltoncostaea oceani TaxID=2843216 RepID=UPI001C3C61D7|nr:hypothetical protein [Miltoncostaea oceani]